MNTKSSGNYKDRQLLPNNKNLPISKNCVQPTKLPPNFLSNRSSILILTPSQQHSQPKGSQIFINFLLTHLQIQHHISKYIFKSSKNNATKNQQNSSQSASLAIQPQQSDALSVASSSVNMRQRKVSFGIIPPLKNNLANNNQTQHKKKRKEENLWILPSTNISSDINQQKIRRNQKYKKLLKRFKTFMYEQAGEMDKKLLHQKDIKNTGEYLSDQNSNAKQKQTNNNNSQNKQMFMKYSLSVMKIFKRYFPQQPCASNINKFQFSLQFLTESIINTDHVSFLQVFNQLIKKHFNLSSQQKDINDTYPFMNDSLSAQYNKKAIDNFISLLKLFQFQNLQNEFQLIYLQLNDIKKEDNNSLTINQNNRMLYNQTKSNQHNQGSCIGFGFLNGFYSTVFLNGNGYLVSIDIEKVVQIPDGVKKAFKQSYRKLLIQQSQNNAKNNSNGIQSLPLIIQPQYSLQKIGSSLQQPQPTSQPSLIQSAPVVSNFLGSISQQAFISNYNHKYFKNQKLIYKQKQKLSNQHRFIQQQNIAQLLPTTNYPQQGYQILINSKHSNGGNTQNNKLINNNENFFNPFNTQTLNNNTNINMSKLTNSKSSNKNNYYQHQGYQFNMQNSIGSSSYTYERQNTGQFGNGINDASISFNNTNVKNNNNNSHPFPIFRTNSLQHKQNNNDATFATNIIRYSFHPSTQQKDQIQSQQYVQDFQERQQFIDKQKNGIQNYNNESDGYAVMKNSDRRERRMVEIISRDDFQISDNEILDDIERVLI